MSKSDDVKSDDGSGDWFKVRDSLFCANPGNDGALTKSWCEWGQPGIEFVVPDTIPDGEYLVRVEHIPLHGAQGILLFMRSAQGRGLYRRRHACI
jgi:hypothetical protein